MINAVGSVSDQLTGPLVGKVSKNAKDVGISRFQNSLDNAVKQDAKPNESNKADERPENIDKNQDNKTEKPKDPEKPNEAEKPGDQVEPEDPAKEMDPAKAAELAAALAAAQLTAEAEQVVQEPGAQQATLIGDQAQVPQEPGKDQAALEAGQLPVADDGEAQFVSQVASDINKLAAQQVEQQGAEQVAASDQAQQNGDADTDTDTGDADGEFNAFTGTLAAGAKAAPTQQAPEIPQAPAVIDVEQGRETLTTQLVDSIQSAVSKETEELTIQFKPSVLGGLVVKLIMTDDGLTAQLITNSRQAHVMMTNEINQLQETLKDRGIPVTQVEVRDQSSMSMGFSDQRQSFFSQGEQQQRVNYVPYQGTEEIESMATAMYGNMLIDAPDQGEGPQGVDFSA